MIIIMLLWDGQKRVDLAEARQPPTTLLHYPVDLAEARSSPSLLLWTSLLLAAPLFSWIMLVVSFSLDRISKGLNSLL